MEQSPQPSGVTLPLPKKPPSPVEQEGVSSSTPKASARGTVRKSGGHHLKPATLAAPRVSQAHKDKARASLLEAVEERDVGMLQKTIKEASACGIAPKDIESAQRVLAFEQNKELSAEILGVRSVVDTLSQTVQRVQAKISNIEYSREITAPRRDAAAEEWLTNLVRHVEEQIWQSMEQRVEDKVRAAVAKATEEMATSVKALSEMFGIDRSKSPTRQRAGDGLKARADPFALDSNSDEDSDSSGDGAAMKKSSTGKGREKDRKLGFGKSDSSLFPQEAPGLLPERHDPHNLQIHLNHAGKEAVQSIEGSTLGKRASVRNSRLGETLGLKSKDDARLSPLAEESKPPTPKKHVVPPTPLKPIHTHKNDAITTMLTGKDTSDPMFVNIPTMLEEPQNWGIRVREIKKFYDYIKYDLDEFVQKEQAAGNERVDTNLHTVTPRFIKPWTEAFKPYPLAGVMNVDSLCSLKTTSLEEIFTAKVFISHCWNENFKDFVTTMNSILEGDDVVWVCAISICQNVDIQDILGERIEDSPFWRAMPHCRRVAMLIDRKAEPFERAWCALEEYLATYKLRLPFSICMPDTMDEDAWQEVDKKLQNFSIRECKASEAADLRKIMDIIEDKADIIDRVVRDESQKACFAARVMKLATSGKIQDLIPIAMQGLTQVRDGAGRSILHVCAQMNKTEQLKGLLDHNLTSNQRDGSGKAPLHYASELGNIEVARVLIDKKADVNVKDKLHSTPLSLASHHGQVDMVPLLMEAKAFPNMRDNDGLTPLMTACCENHHGRSHMVVKELIKSGANLKIKDAYGHSALTLAAQGNHLDIVNTLLEGKADINSQDYDGATALMYAAGFGYKAVVQTLLKVKADTMVEDKQGYTAQTFAQEDNHEDITQLLLAAQSK